LAKRVSDFDNWLEYWKEVAPKLEVFVANNRLPQAEKFLSGAMGFFSFVVEDFSKKITKNRACATHLYPLIVQLHDLLRSAFFCQVHLLTATSALNLRSAFEITTNLAYIFNHDSPFDISTRLNDFVRYEQIIGSKISPALEKESEEKEREFANKHPYWAKNGRLKENVNWTGEKNNFKEIVVSAKRDDRYFYMHKITSKFVHGSPIVKNVYGSSRGLGPLADSKHATYFNINTANEVLVSLEEICTFFGIAFPTTDYHSLIGEIVTLKAELESQRTKK
jgi:hypothetical protein